MLFISKSCNSDKLLKSIVEQPVRSYELVVEQENSGIDVFRPELYPRDVFSLLNGLLRIVVLIEVFYCTDFMLLEVYVEYRTKVLQNGYVTVKI